MGNPSSDMHSSAGNEQRRAPFPNQCHYETADQLRSALRAGGFEACELIIGVSFAETNMQNGTTSFEGKRLLFA